MRPVWIRARTDLLARWRSWAALALIVGVFGGIVVAAAAGARRTDSAYPDFLGSQHSYQQFMFTVAFEPGTAAISPEQIASLLPRMVTWGTPSNTKPRTDRKS